MSPQILIAEDEPAIADAVAFALGGEGFGVDQVATGEEALAAVQQTPYDLLVLDLMLPGISGIEVCRRVRSEGAIPILMLTARDAEVDRVLGLEAGADDYVTKPFSMAELVSRVRAILRRRDLDRGGGETARNLGRLKIDFARHAVLVDGESVPLTRSEFRLLALLAQEPERVYTRREIMQHLWDSSYVGDQRACDIHVSNLRKKLERDPKRPQQLLTVRGVGYKLVAA